MRVHKVATSRDRSRGNILEANGHLWVQRDFLYDVCMIEGFVMKIVYNPIMYIGLYGLSKHKQSALLIL